MKLLYNGRYIGVKSTSERLNNDWTQYVAVHCGTRRLDRVNCYWSRHLFIKIRMKYGYRTLAIINTGYML